MVSWRNRLRIAFCLLGLLGILVAPARPTIKKLAVVVSAGSKVDDVQLADLAKMCKGAQKAWPDGRTFTLVIKDPDTPDMRMALPRLLGTSGSDLKALIAKLNESRRVVKIVDSDEDLLRTVEATPGAVGILDVYSIDRSIKVLRVDGKLPFDLGYALKGELSS